MFEIKVDATNARDLFAKLAAKINNTRPAMVEIAETMLDSVHENFEVGGRPAWKPLSQQRIKERSQKHLIHGVMRAATWPGKILVEMGNQGGLLGSISRRATNDTAVVGANTEYAGALQMDRPYLVMQQKDLEQAEITLLRHLLR